MCILLHNRCYVIEVLVVNAMHSVDSPTLGFECILKQITRMGIYTMLKSPRSGYRPECIAFTKTLITSIVHLRKGVYCLKFSYKRLIHCPEKFYIPV